MTSEQDDLKPLRAALEADPRIGLPHSRINLSRQDGSLTIQGEVPSIAARRLALRLARELGGDAQLVDCLRVSTNERRGDDDLAAALGRALLAENDLRNCTLIRRDGRNDDALHLAAGEDASGAIAFSVADGVVTLDGHVISLSHKRIAEVLAWWVSGCCQVDNRLRVDPPEEDNDDEVTDAVRLALELDHFVPTDSIRVSTTLGVVGLDGAVSSPQQRERAEYDAWCVPGVNEVLNRLVAA